MHINSPKTTRPSPSELATSTEQVGWRWLLRTLWRRKWAILLPAGLLAVLAAIVVARIPATYEGRAEVFIDPREASAADLRAALSGTQDAQTLQSQVRVLLSRSLAYKAVEALEIAGDPEFNEVLRPPGLLDRAEDRLRTILGSATLVQPEAETPAPSETAPAGVVDRFLGALQVELLPESRVIAITFRSRSPERAAQAANKIAELYILDQLDAKYEATQRATQWLTDKIADLRRQVASSEQAVEKFRSQSGLLQGAGGTMATQQISDLSAQLIVVRTARAEAESRLARLRQVAQSASAGGGVGDVGRSSAIQQLLDQQAQAKRKLVDLTKEYGDRHPQMIATRAELADIGTKVQRELDKSVGALETEVSAARARESALSRTLDQLKGKVGQSANAEMQLRSLERDADAGRTMLETFLARFEQATAQLDSSINEMDARLISRADVPDTASFPPKTLIVLLTFVVAAMLAALIVLALEQLDRGFRSGEQIEKATGLRSLGLVPAVRSSGSGQGPASHLLRHPSSMFGESIRSLYTSILLSPDEAPPRKLLVTSSQPKEGKTTISLCLGRMRALAGHATVIIEADLRRPSLHRVLGIPRQPGLTDVVLGEVQLADALVKDAESGAFLLPAGKLAPDPTEILSSPKMAEILRELARQFELVVVDSPPLVAVADSRLLAAQVDTAVLVVRWGRTPREVVKLAARQLQDAGGRISGVVLSMVDSKKHARYGFADSAYYYGPVKRYYTS